MSAMIKTTIPSHLKIVTSGNVTEIRAGDLTIGSVKHDRHSRIHTSECHVPARNVNQFTSWLYCDDLDCVEHNSIPKGVQFPELVKEDGDNGNGPSIIWTSRADLNTALSELWVCWQTVHQLM
ncbi:hypothetical protein QLL95_gp0028 [Cotonvirus japonicus]|uniref:Uncharacterized protein n=1 Tax=Cotonvirus japonicus TaxID=2811091 RepID=A0ABM7NQX4_9VIRU|nr:hypothetical protein QLL95_gp0028 [Cotonvirus japonicus]BCS82517.1 hypothetical protein [Cotonvirus japonicus]